MSAIMYIYFTQCTYLHIDLQLDEHLIARKTRQRADLEVLQCALEGYQSDANIGCILSLLQDAAELARVVVILQCSGGD